MIGNLIKLSNDGKKINSSLNYFLFISSCILSSDPYSYMPSPCSGLMYITLSRIHDFKSQHIRKRDEESSGRK